MSLIGFGDFGQFSAKYPTRAMPSFISFTLFSFSLLLRPVALPRAATPLRSAPLRSSFFSPPSVPYLSFSVIEFIDFLLLSPLRLPLPALSSQALGFPSRGFVPTRFRQFVNSINETAPFQYIGFVTRASGPDLYRSSHLRERRSAPLVTFTRNHPLSLITCVNSHHSDPIPHPFRTVHTQ